MSWQPRTHNRCQTYAISEPFIRKLDALCRLEGYPRFIVIEKAVEVFLKNPRAAHMDRIPGCGPDGFRRQRYDVSVKIRRALRRASRRTNRHIYVIVNAALLRMFDQYEAEKKGDLEDLAADHVSWIEEYR